MLHGVVGSTFKRPDLEVMTAGVFCRQRYQLQFTGQLVVLRQPQLRLGSMHNDRTDMLEVRGRPQSAIKCSKHTSGEWRTFSLTLARAISSFHLCCSASSRDLLRLVMVCWSSLFSLLILSTSAGVNFWFCSWTCRASRSCFRDSR